MRSGLLCRPLHTHTQATYSPNSVILLMLDRVCVGCLYRNRHTQIQLQFLFYGGGGGIPPQTK